MRHALTFAAVVCLCTSAVAPADEPRSTIVQVELLTGPDGGALTAQDWRSVFEQLDMSLIVRRGVLDDKLEVKERVVGTLRYVTVIGELDRSGRLVFPDRTFARGEGPKLKEWLDELKTYGSQGAPTGKPLWGLNRQQFDKIFAALAVRSEEILLDRPLPEAIGLLKLPAESPLRWSTAAEDRLKRLPEPPRVRQSLAGYSKGTQLAVLLNDHGFAFRPNRTPGGTLELLVEPQAAEPGNHWPVGWPLQQQAPQALPGLFAMTNIDLDQAALPELLSAAAELTSTPMLIDYAELARRQIDPDQVSLRHPLKKTTWSLALRAMLVPVRLNREYWQDESGRAFVWVTAIGKPRPKADAK
jgi:hypothetical protein